MSVYFYMNDVFAVLEQAGDKKRALDALIDVSAAIPDCDGFPNDAFTLASRPTLLDIDSDKADSQLALLLENIPLYHFNMEMALDDALAERTMNATVRAALEKAFAGEILPNAMRGGKRETDDMAGTLRHPMLEHMDRGKLCDIYVAFLRNLGPARADFSFEGNILRKHEEQFLEYFDGFLHGARGKVKAEILLGFSMRIDHNPGKPMESYLQTGERAARKMNVREPHEMLWAWLEADSYQMRRCRDIHRARQVQGLPRLPNWIRADIFALLEKEAMKQYFAQSLKAASATLAMLDKIPTVKKAVQANAEGQVDELLQQLLAQTLNANTPYSGAAGKFADAAARRAAEAGRTWLS